MWTILITLAIGFIIGRFNLLPEKYKSSTRYITTGGLITLLVSMGAGLSSNTAVLQRISELGLSAFAIALASVIGSVFLVMLVEKSFFFKKEGGDLK